MKLVLRQVRARRFLRKLRGVSQAHLIEADDDRCYVVKCSNNFEGVRILINESISSFLLQELGVLTPRAACVEMDEAFLAAFPQVSLRSQAEGVRPVRAGLHFGSQYPGRPAATPVYDFLPDAMLERLRNRADFFGALVFDKWVSNADGRQAIFFRARAAEAAGVPCRWIAQVIDNGHAFQGVEWTFRDSPVQGVYPRSSVYGGHVSMQQVWPWIEIIHAWPRELFEGIAETLPGAWTGGQEPALRRLLDGLYQRRTRLPELLGEWVDWMHKSKPEDARTGLLARASYL